MEVQHCQAHDEQSYLFMDELRMLTDQISPAPSTFFLYLIMHHDYDVPH